MKKQIFSGLALGILVGTIIGLSISEVTGIILGALTSLLTAFFGLRPNKEGEQSNYIVIGMFSIACLAGIIGGLILRNNNLLSPTLEQEVAEYRNANFTDAEIKQILLVKKLGLIPEGMQFEAAAKEKGKNTSLMAGEEVLNLCASDLENASLDEIRKAFDNSGGKYQKIEQQLSLVVNDPQQLRTTLLLISEGICRE